MGMTRPTDAQIHLAQQQAACVRSDPSTVETAHYFPTPQGVKFKLSWITLCRRKAFFLLAITSWSQKCFAMENSLFEFLR